ncbi:MAG: type III glutamate--ammonia ligase [SAR324 cluster bacterium]|nr:type III glutamate--ammonia ligase [SAR324 cluster bacterium]
MGISLAEKAREKGIRYFLISFTDLFGVVRSKLVPTDAITGMQKNGAGFAGFAAYLDMTPADSDMFGLPDADRLIQLPWKPEVGWLPSDIYLGGKIVAHGPRTVLKQVLTDAGEKGFHVKTGVECEYFILNPEGTAVADSADIQPKPCYDQQALMRRYDLISEICDHMQTLEWGPYQNDHEDANGQFEMNWDYTEALTTADRHSFFKYMTKTIAEKHGFRATFMPKPISSLTGNGCHAHVSVWSKDGKTNLMEDTHGELGLSKLAYHFIGGLLKHAESLAAITNPVVNSYKRINAPRTTSGATWSPNTVTYSGNNRTHMIRIPDTDRIEVRLADGAANPYLLQAVLIGAGLWGIENKTDPGKRLDIDMYAEGHTVKNAPKLPLNLLDALRAFENNKTIRHILGVEFADSYIKLKMEEWNSYMQHFSEWERQNALDV